VFNEAKGYANHLDFHPSGTCLGVATTDNQVRFIVLFYCCKHGQL
jgi:hypothetical protein